MRTYLFMFLALGVAVGAFVLYQQSQTPIVREVAEKPVTPQAMDLDAEGVGDIGPGRRPWVKSLDRLGRLAYRFRTEDYTPRGGGRIDVRNVEAEFFQYVPLSKDPADTRTRTQRVRITGKTGQFEVQEGPQASGGGFEKTSGGPPKRGILNDVVILVFPDLKKNDVSVRAVTPNIAFDNETFEITTHEYTDANGVFVPADQVPVHATGDYEFDGRGMTLRWNDVDGRLEYLEIAHGNYLVVRDREALGEGGGGLLGGQRAAPPPVSALGPPTPRQPLVDDRGVPIQFAAAGKPPAPGGPKKPGNKGPPKKPKPTQPPYRAAFDQDVRILEGEPRVSEAELARADLMHIEFLSKDDSNATTRPTTKPATAPASLTQNPAGSTPPATPATNPSAIARNAGVGPATRPATQPSDDDNKPIIVRWTGKLRVIPIDASSGEVAPPLKPGESIVKLFGQKAPVQLTRETSRVWCTNADYFTGDGSALLRSSPQFGPVVLHQLPDPQATKGSSQEAHIVTQQINYSGTDRVAVLHGQSTAHIILPQTRPATQPATAPAAQLASGSPTTRPAQVLDAKWNKQGRLHFKPGLAGGSAMAFDRAELEGDVDVKHPQLAMKSQKLDLYFEEKLAAPTTRPSNHGKPATQPALGARPTKRPATQPSTRPVSQTLLKQMIATTGVWCDLTDSAGKRQTVTTDRLTLATGQDADGKLYPRLINADGNAHAYDGEQDLKAGHLELILAPSTRPTTQPATREASAEVADGGIDMSQVELKQMKAWEKVHVRNAEGSTAIGERMEVTVVDGQPIARITGAPLATVTDPKGSRVSGPIIDFDPRRQWAKVTGRGSIHAIQADSKDDEPASATRPSLAKAATRPATQPAQPPKFADIFWEREAVLDGAKNLITVAGPVLIISTDTDGTRQTATGQRARIELLQKPATQPTTPARSKSSDAFASFSTPTQVVVRPGPTVARPGPLSAAQQPSNPQLAVASVPAPKPTTKTAKSTTRPASTGIPGMASGGMDILKDKVVSAFELEEKAVVSSTLADATGILRQAEIRSERLRYETGETAAPAAASATKAASAAGSPTALNTNGNGRLIVPGPGQMIYRDHRPPTTQPVTGSASGSPAPDQARGATAFRWDGSLVYDQPTRKATMVKDVLIVHQADDPQAEPVRVAGDRVEATFEPKPEDPPKIAVNGKPLPKPATKPAAGGDLASTAMQLKWLTITGHVSMDRGGSTLTAERADYDPSTGWLKAVGAGRTPAMFSNPTGTDVVWADEIYWNTQTWMTRFTNIRGRGGSGDRTGLPTGR